jgi:probable F420-dependent oxidoreductase
VTDWKRRLGATGVWSAELHFGDQGAAGDTAAELEELGFDAIWYPGGFGGPVFDMGRNLLAATRRITVAIGVLNMWMHSPQATADGRAELETAHPERFLVGLGISHPAFVDTDDTKRYARPLSSARAYLDGLDSATPPVGADARVLAALRPRMRELARDRTSGIHSYFVPAAHTAVARETLGPDALLAPMHAVVLERDATRAREIARTYTRTYLALPNYVNNLLELGYDEADVVGGGSDRLVDDLVAWGDAETVHRKLGAHRDAGADHVCLQVVGTGWGAPPFAAPRAAYRELAGALVA